MPTLSLSLSEAVVLALVAEGPTHGFSIASKTAAGQGLGAAFRVPAPVVYRCLDRLEGHGLVEAAGIEESRRGPPRTIFRATDAGRRHLEEWLRAPTLHVRELRTELLAKLALLDRRGESPAALLAAQKAVLDPIVESLRVSCSAAEGFDRTLLEWRLAVARAATHFLDTQSGRASRHPQN